MSSSIEMVRDTFNFEVQKLPLSGPDNLPTPWYGLFRSDNGELVTRQSKTRQYVPHQTQEVVALAEAATNAFESECNIQCHFHLGHHLVINPSNQDRLRIYGEKDNVFPRVIIDASYDNKSFKASIGFYRDLCKNLSMLQSVKESHVTFRHGVNLHDQIDELTETFSTLRESWGTVSGVIERMESTRVNVSEFLMSAIPPKDENRENWSTRYSNMLRDVIATMRSEAYRSNRSESDIDQDSEISVWQAYNAVQGYFQHQSSRKGVDKDKRHEMQIARVIAGIQDPRMRTLESHAMSLISA